MDKKEQARITRQQNKAIRDAARAERDTQKMKDRVIVLDALRAILKDPEATSAQRIYAVAVLDAMQYYHFIPCSVKQPGADSDALIADFARRLEEYQANNK